MTTPPPQPHTPAAGEPAVYLQPVDDRGTPLAPPRALNGPARMSGNVPPRNAQFTGHGDLLGELSQPSAERRGAVLLQFLGHGLSRTGIVVVDGLDEVTDPSARQSLLEEFADGTRWVLLDTCRATKVTEHSDAGLRGQLEQTARAVLLAGPAGADAWLERIGTPRDPLWRDAAASVLLDEAWQLPGPADDPVAYFKKRLHRAVGQWRPSWERQLNRRTVGLLSEPRFHGGELTGTVADTLVSAIDVERDVLDELELTGDPCMLQVMAKLSPRETRIADLYARNPHLSWQEAAALAGESDPHKAGDSLSHRLLRLGRLHVERAQAARQDPHWRPPEGCPHGLAPAGSAGPGGRRRRGRRPTAGHG